MRAIDFSEISVRNEHYSLRNNPDDPRHLTACILRNNLRQVISISSPKQSGTKITVCPFMHIALLVFKTQAT